MPDTRNVARNPRNLSAGAPPTSTGVANEVGSLGAGFASLHWVLEANTGGNTTHAAAAHRRIVWLPM